jgi:hypothetical protein
MAATRIRRFRGLTKTKIRQTEGDGLGRRAPAVEAILPKRLWDRPISEERLGRQIKIARPLDGSVARPGGAEQSVVCSRPRKDRPVAAGALGRDPWPI